MQFLIAHDSFIRQLVITKNKKIKKEESKSLLKLPITQQIKA